MRRAGRWTVPGAARTGFLLTLLLSAIGPPLLALDPTLTVNQYTLRRWSIEEGLPQVSVNAIVQDHDGYLWIGTFGGLVRFDGAKMDRLDSDGRCSDRVLALAVDATGEIWVGSERSGLCRTLDGRLVPFTSDEEVELGGIAEILPSDDNGIWLASSDGLIHVDDATMRRLGTEDGLPHRNVLTVAEHADGSLWVGTKAGLCVFEDDRCSVPDWGRHLLGTRVTALHHGAFGASWVGSQRGFDWVKDGEVERVFEISGPDADITSIAEDRNGGIWVGTHPGGLVRILPQPGALGGIDRATTDPVKSLFEDREGNLWVGTAANGLVKLGGGAATPIGLAPDGTDLPVMPVLAEGGGRAWAGTFCRGLVRIENGETRFFGTEHGLLNTCVSALAKDHEGTIWVGTSGSGLYRMDGESRFVATNGPVTPEGLVRAVVEVRPGELLIGTDDGLHRYDVAKSEFELVDATRGLDIFFVEPFDPEGTWLGTLQGAVLLTESETRLWGIEQGLRHPAVRAVYRDDRGAVWIGTYGGGLYRLDGEELFSFSTAPGLPDRAVSSIVEDDDGHIWMTGNVGVTRAERTALEAFADGTADRVVATVFDRRNGMPVTETNGGAQPAASLDSDGQLWVPTVAGIAIFDTRRETYNLLPPPVRIERVLVDGVEHDPDQRAVLAADAKNLEIHYTALAFTAPEKVQFRVRLAGFDDDWVETGDRRVAYYPVIPPGDLRFRVVAANEDGVWNLEGDEFQFEMRRRLHETPWFFLLMLGTVAAASFGTYRLKVAAGRHREQQLSEEVSKRTAELARLTELTEIINEAVTIEEVMDRLYDDLRPIVPYDRIGLALVDQDRVVLRAVWSKGEQEATGIGRGFEQPIAGSSLEKLLETGKPRIIEDLEQYLAEHPDSESTRQILQDGIRSSLTCPLRAMGQPVGFVFFSSSTPRTYDQSHVTFLEQIAGHLSLIVVKSKLYEELDRLASLDALTGLPNRRSFERHLTTEWRRSARESAVLGLLMIDVDAFKQYNDHYGHVQGDEALKLVGRVLQERVQRAGDMAARIGGEEFAVVLPGTGVEDSRQVAEELRAAVEARGLPHLASPSAEVLTVSVGVASTIPVSDLDADTLLEAADRALYRAKQGGRNRISGEPEVAK